jgi:hypothetical protein
MARPDSSLPPEHPTIHRPTDAAKFTEKHQAELSRLIEEPWRAQAKTHAEIVKAKQRANAPVLELLAKSADAAAASKALSRLRAKAWTDRVGVERTGVSRFHGGDFLNTFRPIGPGINVFGPPYDFEVRQRPTARAPRQRLTGTTAPSPSG